MIKNLPPLPFGGPWQSVNDVPPVNGWYDLQLTDSSGSPGHYAGGYWSITSFHGKPLRMPMHMLKTFAKAWRVPHPKPLPPIGVPKK